GDPLDVDDEIGLLAARAKLYQQISAAGQQFRAWICRQQIDSFPHRGWRGIVKRFQLGRSPQNSLQQTEGGLQQEAKRGYYFLCAGGGFSCFGASSFLCVPLFLEVPSMPGAASSFSSFLLFSRYCTIMEIRRF